jgi:hypothetical protein
MSVLKRPDSLLGALYYNCVEVLVMSTIFVFTSISEVADEQDSVEDGFYLVLSVLPSVC